jgi:hypothetical protein
MVNLNIAQQRLHNQLITQPTFTKPDDVVRTLGPIQAQDYAGAKWALGLRLQNATENIIEQACNAGTILRTHLMRPTWHFVASADIRWILALTAPRVNALSSYYYRKSEMDDALFSHSNAVLEKALAGGKQLMRSEIQLILEQAGIATDDLRLTHIMMRAELDMIICSGARRGKQFTYALLAERAPHAPMLEKSEALAELARRYFTSRGPATLEDFVWWSGLTTTDARTGLQMVRSELLHEVIADKTYWFSAAIPPILDTVPIAHFLPPYDEYTIAYKDRSAVLDAAYTIQTRNGIFSPIIVVDGLIVGTWKRTFKKDSVLIETSLFSSPTEKEAFAISSALKHYSTFLGITIENVPITAVL